MTDDSKGVMALVIACVVWGLSPLYYALLTHLPPLEVLAYRCIWSFVFFAGVLCVQGRLHLVRDALRTRQSVAVTLLATAMITLNWFIFIYAVFVGQALSASLGYYIFPLVAVVLGRVVFRERLSGVQSLAVVLAGVAVVILAVGLGAPPWIALVLAISFGVYSLLKKRLDMPPIVSVTAEVTLLVPLAFGGLAVFGSGDLGLHTHLLLILAGPLTATPLILFSYATRRVRLSTVGLVQYINPTLQFCVAVFVFAEPFTHWHAIAFPVIWVALILYSVSGVRQDKAARKRDSNVGTSSTTDTKSSKLVSAKP